MRRGGSKRLIPARPALKVLALGVVAEDRSRAARHPVTTEAGGFGLSVHPHNGWMGLVRAFFGAHGQLGVGIFVFAVSVGFWALGTETIPHAASLPWRWSPSTFIFHASMFALVLAAYAIIATALGYRATERVETKVVETIERAGEVNVS